MTEVRPIRPDDEAAWRELWAGYCQFYQVTLPKATSDATWRRICDPASAIHAIAGMHDGRIAGFANYVVHENTWETQPVCYLEDLFVAPDNRGSGVGTAMLDWLRAAMRSQGWARLYWVTHRDNAAARRVYDRYVRADDFVRYVVRKAA